jgi:hypothetical protein
MPDARITRQLSAKEFEALKVLLERAQNAAQVLYDILDAQTAHDEVNDTPMLTRTRAALTDRAGELTRTLARLSAILDDPQLLQGNANASNPERID